MGRAITIYEFPDDFGQTNDAGSYTNGNTGVPIACCNILPLGTLTDATVQFTHHQDDRRRLLNNAE